MDSKSIRHESGPFWAVTSLIQFSRFFKNWKEVWSAYRASRPLPPLVLNSGLTLQHEPADDAIRMFREFFVDRRYTSKKFYVPRCGDVVVDLGAKNGFFALSMEWLARGVRIHSFEQTSERRLRLKRNVTTNRLNPFITIYPFVVGVPAAAQAQLQEAGKSGLASLQGRPNSSFSMLDVLPVLSLTEAIDLTSAAQVDLLKIDADDDELTILEGADDETWSKIQRVVIKYHRNLDRERRERIIDLLVNQGFDLIDILPDRRHRGAGLIRAARDR
jgi:FkbM family methyltransferase